MLTAIAALTLASTASAKGIVRDPEQRFSVMGLFGMNISNFRAPGYLQFGSGMDPKAGFNFGARAEYILPECFGTYVSGGVNYTMKGSKSNIPVLGGKDDVLVSRPMYIEIPVHVGYRYDVLDDLGVYADFGPYFAIGTNGKFIAKDKNSFTGDVKERFFRNGNAPVKTQRWDCGLGFRLGAEYAQHYNLIFSFDWGLTDMLTQSCKSTIVADADPGTPTPYVKNFNAGITFGYRF